MAFETKKEKETVEELLTREEKEALLDQKIQRMKIKNAERMKKFQEIQEDKKWAEREGRAVTLKQCDFSDNEDDSWPKRTDRYEDVDEDHHQKKDLRQVLQQRKTETKVVQELQSDSRKKQNASKYTSILTDGPPPDPAYNYLADRGRDSHYNEKREDNKNQRGFQRKTRGDRHHNEQRANHYGTDRSSQRKQFEESKNNELRSNYDQWRKEREDVDHERQKTKEGLPREWNCQKHENLPQGIHHHLSESVGSHCGIEIGQKTFASSGESQSRGTSYRGGRGRGRLRPDVRSGTTPDREVGINYQKPPRFRNSPDDQRPGNVVKQQSEQGFSGVGSHSVVRSEVDALCHNLKRDSFQLSRPEQRESARSTAVPLADVIVNPAIKTYNNRGSIVITAGNQSYNGKSEAMTLTIQNKEPERSPDVKTKAEFLAHAQFSKSPKKGIGSGRIAPPQKGRPVVSRGKDLSRRMVSTKGRRLGNRISIGESENEEITIGIAVITTPGDKAEPITAINDINDGAEEVNCNDIPAKKETKVTSDQPKSVNLLEGEIEEDDDDDEWEDVDEGSVEIDDNLKQELNKSNESIHRFIEENTLHPDGTNWNIDVDGDGIPWSDEVDAESQERRRIESECSKLQTSDSFIDTSFASSCSIVESPFEQSEVLSSLLTAACESSLEEPAIEPCTSTEDVIKFNPRCQLNEEFAQPCNIAADFQEITETSNVESSSVQSSEDTQNHGNGIQEIEFTKSVKAKGPFCSSDVHVPSEVPLVDIVRADGDVLNGELSTPEVTSCSSVCESVNSGSVLSQTTISDSVDQEIKSIKSSEDLTADALRCDVESP